MQCQCRESCLYTWQVSRHRYQAVFTFPNLALDISQHVQSVGYPSFCKDQKRKLLRHRHFCNEFAANNGPEGLRDDFIYQPSISSFWYHPSMVCFVLLGFIQVYSVFSGDCIHSITRVKMIESLLCASMPIVTDAPDWYWIVCLSTLGAMFISLWTISADCLFQIPTHPSHSEGMVTFSLTWYQSPVWGPQAWRCMLTCSRHTILDCCGYPSLNQTIAIKLVFAYWDFERSDSGAVHVE